jgi:glutamate dehydrogenase
VRVLEEKLEELLPRSETKELRRRERGYVKQGVPEVVARRVAALPVLAAVCDIWRIAGRGETGGPGVEEVGRIYFVVGDRFQIDWLRQAALRLSIDGRWQKAAAASVVDELYAHQSELTRQVLEVAGGGGRARRVIEAWEREHRAAVARTEEMMRELKSAGALDLAMLMVALDQLRRLVEEG